LMALIVVWALVAMATVDAAPPLIAGVDVAPPRKLKTVQADFPDVARRAVPPIEGLILLQVTLNEMGRPADIVVLGKGVPLLDGAAIEAVRRWEYEPTLVDGTPRRVMLKTVAEFFLSSKSRQQHFLQLASSANEDVGLRLYAIQSLLANPMDEKGVRKALEVAATDTNEKVANAARQGLSKLGQP
jgi:TonB family protein